MRNHSAVPAKDIDAAPENGGYDGISRHPERCACAAPIRLDLAPATRSAGSDSVEIGIRNDRSFAQPPQPCDDVFTHLRLRTRDELVSNSYISANDSTESLAQRGLLAVMPSGSRILRPIRTPRVARNVARTHPRKSNSPYNLVVMSNRAPIRIVRDLSGERIETAVGGVGGTFQRLLEEKGGTWIAWPGGRTMQKRVAMPPYGPRFDLVFVDLSERDVSQYYYGMCNQGLWPLMHYMTPICHFSRAQWNDFQRVNMNFATTAATEASSSSIV